MSGGRMVGLDQNAVLGGGRQRRDPRILFAFGLYLTAIGVVATLIWRFAPDQIILQSLGRQVLVNNFNRRLFIRALSVGLAVPSVLIVEFVVVGWNASSLNRLLVRPSPSGMTDLACFALGQTPLMTGLMAVASLGVSLVSGLWLHQIIARVTCLSISLYAMPIAVQIAALCLSYSFFDYWSHRLDHSKYFWPLHRFHHGATEFTVLTAGRMHPATFTAVINGVLPPLLLGVSPEAIVIMNTMVVMLRYVIHSRIDSSFGWVGRYLVQSPVHHRLHHALDSGRASGHFSLCPFWDRLFGTWRGDVDQSLPIGVDVTYRHGPNVLKDMWRDYAEFWGLLFALIGRWTARLAHKSPRNVER